MIIQGCLNGSRPAGFHPRLPTTPAAIVADGVATVAAGAHELHVHIRGDDGRETLRSAEVARTVGGLRERLPGTFIGISTGAWIERDDGRRRELIDGWQTLPDYASVNLSEEDAPALFAHLVRRGVAVEAGLATVADADRYVERGLAGLTLRLLIEIGEQDEVAAHALADEIIGRLTRAGVRKPVMVHGADATMWSFVERAARTGLSTRVGLEDGSTLPDGSTAASNAEIIEAATAIMTRRLPAGSQ